MPNSNLQPWFYNIYYYFDQSITMFAKIEKALVDRGQVGAAVKVQKVARVFETPTNKKAQRKWIEDAMGCELKTHLLLQGEHGDFAARNRLEQCQRDGVVSTKEQQEVMDGLQDSLRMYNKKSWFQTRNYPEHLFNKPKGPFHCKLARSLRCVANFQILFLFHNANIKLVSFVHR